MKLANSYLVTFLILLACGCDSGGGSSTPESVIAPCDLIYPVNQVVALCGIPMVVQVPDVQCGTVTDWTVFPELPEGLVLDFLDGSISGTAVVAGSDQFYAVTASNEGGSSSFSIQITIGSPSVAPTGLAYPLDLIIVAANVALEAQVPTVDCGDVTTWDITPSLPAGLVFDVTSGIVSGTALGNGYNADHVVVASNDVGLASTSFQLRIDPTFTYTAEVGAGSYSGVTGEGQLDVVLRLEEDSGNPDFPTFISALNLALGNQPAQVIPVSAEPSEFLQSVNGGSGPSFWFANLQDDQVIIATVFSFTAASVTQFEVIRDLVVINYETNPSEFINQTETISTPLQWIADSLYTPTASDMLVVSDLAEGVIPVWIDAEALMIRND